MNNFLRGGGKCYTAIVKKTVFEFDKLAVMFPLETE
jgi:hypothetical protein